MKVIIHKKVCSKLQNCAVSIISSALEDEIKLAILKKASLLNRNKKDKDADERKKFYGDDLVKKKDKAN